MSRSDRQRYVKIETLWGDTDGCRVCGRDAQSPFDLYCSRYCKNVAEAVYGLFNWRTIRKWVRDGRDDRTCVRCGRASEELPDDVHLEVDHITPVSKGSHPFDPRNLQTLCEPCHEKKGVRDHDFRDEDYKEAPTRREVAMTTLSDFTDMPDQSEPEGPSALELGRNINERDGDDSIPDMDEVDWGPTVRPLDEGDPCPECDYPFDSDEWNCRHLHGGDTLGETWKYECPQCEQETCSIGT